MILVDVRAAQITGHFMLTLEQAKQIRLMMENNVIDFNSASQESVDAKDYFVGPFYTTICDFIENAEGEDNGT